MPGHCYSHSEIESDDYFEAQMDPKKETVDSESSTVAEPAFNRSSSGSTTCTHSMQPPPQKKHRIMDHPNSLCNNHEHKVAVEQKAQNKEVQSANEPDTHTPCIRSAREQEQFLLFAFTRKHSKEAVPRDIVDLIRKFYSLVCCPSISDPTICMPSSTRSVIQTVAMMTDDVR